MDKTNFDAWHADMVAVYTLEGGAYRDRSKIEKAGLRRLFTESRHRARARLIMRDVLTGEMTTGEIAAKYSVVPSIVSNIIAGRQQREATTALRAVYRQQMNKPKARRDALPSELVRKVFVACQEPGRTQTSVAQEFGLGQRVVSRIANRSYYARVTMDLWEN